jgi:hypothetical protein
LDSCGAGWSSAATQLSGALHFAGLAVVAVNPVLQVCTWGGKSEREEEKPGFFHCFWLPSFLQGPTLPSSITWSGIGYVKISLK